MNFLIFLLTFILFHHRGVDAHASLIIPPTRNSIDVLLPPWSNGKHPPTGTIEPYECHCTNGSLPCNSGQGCFWFSQGCTIGCDKCDGDGARFPNYDHCPGKSIKPTLNDPKWRTINQAAEPGTEADFTKYHPWRAPGRAPVFDACGMAGGVDHEVFNAGAYNTTIYAKQGDLGSKVLPMRKMGTIWERGTVAKTRWQMTAAHGGGYQFRLCPANETLTEKCFQRMPLKFAEPDFHTIIFSDPSKNRKVNATLVPDSVTGTGDWMKNPIPWNDENCRLCCDYVVPDGEHCNYKCPGCGAPLFAADGACPVDCAHYGLPHGGTDSRYYDFPVKENFHKYAIEDPIQVPANIAPGEYVLGWRWDAEATSQVWSNCADITIV